MGKQLHTILKHHANTTESLTIDEAALHDTLLISYLEQMDCKEIIVQANDLSSYKLRMFARNTKIAKVGIKGKEMNLSMLESEVWSIKFMSDKCFKNLQKIIIHQSEIDAPTLFDQAFQGQLRKFKRKEIISDPNKINQNLNFNQILINQDNSTEKLVLSGRQADYLSILFLNNCRSLLKLTLNFRYFNATQKNFQLRETQLQELEINCFQSDQLVNQLVKSSFKTLQSLRIQSCSFDLSLIQHSKILRKLAIVGCSVTNPELMATIKSLEEIETDTDSVIQNLWENKTSSAHQFLQVTIFNLPMVLVAEVGHIARIQNLQHQISYTLFAQFENKNLKRIALYKVSKFLDLPDFVSTIELKIKYKFRQLNKLLLRNPHIKEITLYIPYQYIEVASLLQSYSHIKFNFIKFPEFFRTDQLYTFEQSLSLIIPSNNEPSISTQPDEKLYELLFQRISDPQELYAPYAYAIMTLHISDPMGNAITELRAYDLIKLPTQINEGNFMLLRI
ncbi:hypothetical protein FGO68_gene4112 [Halteria grandinella]|uniref:Uncharacterized protein n=1 Tax=Halteria grandinella TaxID=5974 RepID=A0A8J8P020_HALGN|nr:hypothetical protein FGO68_gene4112 [Halteria grandinella]